MIWQEVFLGFLAALYWLGAFTEKKERVRPTPAKAAVLTAAHTLFAVGLTYIMWTIR